MFGGKMLVQKCKYCNRPFAESSDAWMNLAGDNNPNLPQKKDFCGAVGDMIHGNALAGCEKWERIYLKSEVKRLKKTNNFQLVVFIIILLCIFIYLVCKIKGINC